MASTFINFKEIFFLHFLDYEIVYNQGFWDLTTDDVKSDLYMFYTSYGSFNQCVLCS